MLTAVETAEMQIILKEDGGGSSSSPRKKARRSPPVPAAFTSYFASGAGKALMEISHGGSTKTCCSRYILSTLEKFSGYTCSLGHGKKHSSFHPGAVAGAAASKAMNDYIKALPAGDPAKPKPYKA